MMAHGASASKRMPQGLANAVTRYHRYDYQTYQMLDSDELHDVTHHELSDGTPCGRIPGVACYPVDKGKAASDPYFTDGSWMQLAAMVANNGLGNLGSIM